MTYLELVNALARQFNEPQLDSNNFANAGGIHANLKDYINWSLMDIYQDQWKWPFTYKKKTETFTKGQRIADLPTPRTSVDQWSFFIEPDSNDDVQPRVLYPIDWYQWIEDRREVDARTTNVSESTPDWVYIIPDGSFGVSPVPDKEYDISFYYWEAFVPLVNHDDETDVPEQYINVIIEGASSYLNRLQENYEAANFNSQMFRQGLGHMRSQLINFDLRVRDTRVPSTLRHW